jgi:hypothetical protein
MSQRISVFAPAWSIGDALSTLLAVACLAAGCSQSGTTPAPTGHRTFTSPEAAAQALYEAAKADDSQAVLLIVGPNAKDLLLSGDAEQDKAAFASFTAAYDRMHRLGKLQGGGRVLIVGIRNYPFPFPLETDSLGKWYFDTDAGPAEFLARRVGDNELAVMDVLNAMADAQAEYYSAPRDGSQVRQYAQKFISNEGKQDGLYWKAASGEPESPLGPLAARAGVGGYTQGSEEAAPFHGYLFRIVTQQGLNAAGGERNYIVNGEMTEGFAFLAYPVQYRKTGVMTFLINQDGEIFEKDLGPQTAELARSITVYDTDPSWRPVQYPSLDGQLQAQQ